jgi:hypothetical protein
MLQGAASKLLFLVRISLGFERNSYRKSQFEGGERLILCHLCLFNLGKETHVTAKGNPYVLEAGAFSLCFPCEN